MNKKQKIERKCNYRDLNVFEDYEQGGYFYCCNNCNTAFDFEEKFIEHIDRLNKDE